MKQINNKYKKERPRIVTGTVKELSQEYVDYNINDYINLSLKDKEVNY